MTDSHNQDIVEKQRGVRRKPEGSEKNPVDVCGVVDNERRKADS